MLTNMQSPELSDERKEVYLVGVPDTSIFLVDQIRQLLGVFENQGLPYRTINGPLTNFLIETKEREEYKYTIWTDRDFIRPKQSFPENKRNQGLIQAVEIHTNIIPELLYRSPLVAIVFEDMVEFAVSAYLKKGVDVNQLVHS